MSFGKEIAELEKQHRAEGHPHGEPGSKEWHEWVTANAHRIPVRVFNLERLRSIIMLGDAPEEEREFWIAGWIRNGYTPIAEETG